MILSELLAGVPVGWYIDLILLVNICVADRILVYGVSFKRPGVE